MSRKKRKNDRYGRGLNDPLPASDAESIERVPMPERPEPKKFNAPLWAGAIVVLAVIAVLLVNVFGSKDTLTVEGLNSPAVAALDGGSDVYPANSKLAFTENVKFGYLPAPTLSALGDGTIVAADPQTAAESMGLKKDLEELSRDDFLDQTIAPPRKDTSPGEPITWDQIVDEFGTDTVLVPAIATTEVAGPALTTITEAGLEESVIVRTADAEVARAAADAGIDAMFTGDPTTSNEESLSEQGYTAIAVDAGSAAKWAGTDGVWATGVKDKKQLDELTEAGVVGALSTNPYEVLPSEVKTD